MTLPPLPSSNDKFWDKARKYRTEFVKREPCEHYFKYRGANQVVCEKCQVGYIFTGKEYLIDGKIEVRT